MPERDDPTEVNNDFRAGANEYAQLSQEATTDSAPPQPEPRVVYRRGVHQDVSIDAATAGRDMQKVGLSPESIEDKTIYVDNGRHFTSNGTTLPRSLGKLRYWRNPELRDAPGSIVRISTEKRGVPRTSEAMNKTFMHENEHLAQEERKDPKLKRGLAGMIGLAAAGAVAGKLATNKSARFSTKMIGTIIGAIVGHQIGYQIAPHERQARSRADETTTDAIKRRGQDLPPR